MKTLLRWLSKSFKYKRVIFKSFRESTMSASCEAFARHVLPLYRSFVAKELVKKYGFTQVEAAKKLGATQAAISQYVTSKRGIKPIHNYDEIAPQLQATAAKVAKRLSKRKMSPEEFSASLCDLCTRLRKAKKIP
jgi:predicted transcriptional regulator